MMMVYIAVMNVIMRERIKMTENELEKKVMDVCYDREVCKSLGIDYNNITKGDIDRIKYLIESGYLK